MGMSKNKSPGLDGYGSDFSKATWMIIGDDVKYAVLEFLNNGKILK